MFRSIVIAGILALAFGVSACGGTDTAESSKTVAVKSTPTPVATPDPKEKQAALLVEAMTVIERVLTLNNRVGNTNDPDRICNYILPQMNAKMDHLDDLMEKLDEAGMPVKKIGKLRSDYSGLAGAVASMEEVCSSYGY